MMMDIFETFWHIGQKLDLPIPGKVVSGCTVHLKTEYQVAPKHL